jgi:Uma2 family endonuclease
MKSGIRTKLVYEDLASIPPDGKRYELLDGDLHVTAAPNLSHQLIVGRLFTILGEYLLPPAQVILSPFDVILSKKDVVEPDLVVVRDIRQVPQRGVEGAPFLVIEVLSPSTAQFDCTVKASSYAKHGIAHYWIVDPGQQRVECFKLERGKYKLVMACTGIERLVHPDFPGLSLAGLWDSVCL